MQILTLAPTRIGHPPVSIAAWRSIALTLASALLLTSGTARADTVVYNNLTSIVGFQGNGGAVSATDNTTLLGDDITFAAGAASQKVTSFSLAVGNAFGSPVTANLTVEFFTIDGSGGGPGTLLGSATVMATFAGGTSGSVTTQTFTGANLFTIPANGKIWAGFYFSPVAGTTTNAQLNSLGGEAESSPTVGFSNASTFFLGTGPAVTGASNPPGTISANPNSGQPANLGMVFAIPEPSSVLFVALGGAGLVSVVFRRRRR